jgi:hypothetical protein
MKRWVLERNIYERDIWMILAEAQFENGMQVTSPLLFIIRYVDIFIPLHLQWMSAEFPDIVALTNKYWLEQRV